MDSNEIINNLEEIDRIFSESNVPIHQRSIKAVVEFGKRCNLSLPIVTADLNINHPDYPKQNEYITNAIHDWYEEKYGELLNIDFSLGKTIVEVSGNPLVLNLPKIFGRAVIVWDINKEPSTGNNDLKKNEPVEVNVIDSIRGMTRVLAKDTTKNESKRIVQWFVLAMDVYEFLSSMRDNNLLMQARSDLLTSVQHIDSQLGVYGQSKWSSLQTCEKFLKALISSQGNTFQKHHNLSKLATLAGLTSSDDSRYIQNIQCSPGIRYGEEQTDIEAAVLAHKSVMMLMRSKINKWPN